MVTFMSNSLNIWPKYMKHIICVILYDSYKFHLNPIPSSVIVGCFDGESKTKKYQKIAQISVSPPEK